MPADYPFTITSLTGYSGGGKKMIGQYESSPKDYFLYAPRQYGLGQEHKHLPKYNMYAALVKLQFLCQSLMITILGWRLP